MKNKEKFAKEIVEIACNGKSIAKRNGKLCVCIAVDCKYCDFQAIKNNGVSCEENLKEWCEQEYIEEPEVDWSKVPVDTPVYVRDRENQEWIPRHFAKYMNGKVYAYSEGRTSFSIETCSYTYYEYAKLAEPLENETCKYNSEYISGSDKYKIDTSCGHTFYDIHHAVPFKRCPYCGKRLEEEN